MILSALLGLILGFISAVPVAGPVSALVFSQALRGRYAQARWIALGAAAAETLYCFLAFWGFSRLAPRFHGLFLLAHILAALVLGGLGVYFLKSKKMRNPVRDEHASVTRASRALAMGAGISLMNLSLIATWTATIATLYSMQLFTYSAGRGALFSSGVGIGIFSWFSIFAGLVKRYRDRFADSVLDRMLKGFGVFLMLASIAMVVRLAVKGA